MINIYDELRASHDTPRKALRCVGR